VEPTALIFFDDNYFQMCYSPECDAVVNYRVDRMDSVAVEEEMVCKAAMLQEEDIAAFTK